MPLGELKPILTTLAMPPAGPLLLAALGAWLAWQRRRLGAWLLAAALLALWLLACQAVAARLQAALLPAVAPLAPADAAGVQAIVVLGGGVLPSAPEYGQPQPSAHTLARLRYAAWLGRRTGLPLAFSGGVGWAAAGTAAPGEAEVAARVLRDEYGTALRWAEARSPDTAGNARESWALLAPAGVRRIVLVTDSWHMPRAQRLYQQAGFTVVPAPVGFPVALTRPLLAWLPSTEGLVLSRQVLREWLVLRLLP